MLTDCQQLLGRHHLWNLGARLLALPENQYLLVIPYDSSTVHARGFPIDQRPLSLQRHVTDMTNWMGPDEILESLAYTSTPRYGKSLEKHISRNITVAPL
jgi:hypothetical protein